jgi:hypothetical protein
MKVFNENSKLEKALQEVEAVLQKHNMRIEQGYGGLDISFNGETFETVDLETCGQKVLSFPRSFESERVIFSRE